jgi:hypothetical protein
VAPEIENRQHPSMPITLLVRMVTAIGVMKGETENVNLHGAFIRCQKPLEPGERLFVIAKLPSKPSFNFHAEVVWSRVSRPNDGGTSPGMRVNPNVAYPRRGKPRQSAPNVGARRLEVLRAARAFTPRNGLEVTF